MKATIHRGKRARNSLYQGYGPAWKWYYKISIDGGAARDTAVSDSLHYTRLTCLFPTDRMTCGGKAFPIYGLGCESVTEAWSGRTFVLGPRRGLVEVFAEEAVAS